MLLVPSIKLKYIHTLDVSEMGQTKNAYDLCFCLSCLGANVNGIKTGSSQLNPY